MKTKFQKRCGRKLVDNIGSARSLNDALKAALKRRDASMPTMREGITAEFRRSKHFQGKAVQG